MLSIWERNSFVEYDVLIIGSGILGLSTAISLKDKHPDLDILILERGTLPSGASTKNAGFACFGSFTEILSDINRIGESGTVQLVEDRWKGLEILRNRLGDENIGFRNYGGYELIGADDMMHLEKLEYANALLSDIFNGPAYATAADRIGEFGFSGEFVRSLVFSPYESQLDTGMMMRALIRLAQEKGVMIINNYSAFIDDVGSDYVTVASVNSGVMFSGKQLISCANAFVSQFFPEVKIKPGRGQVIVTKPVEGLPFKGVFHFDEGFYYFRNYGERVLFGGGRNLDIEGEQTTEFGITEKVIASLYELLNDVILPGRDFEIECSWSGIMGFNESKLHEILRLSDNITVGFCCNGMGVALASRVAEKIAGSF